MSRRAMLLLLVTGAVAVTMAAVAWMATYPLPGAWDEAVYFVNVAHDVQAVHAAGLRGFVITYLAEDPARPPAMRLLALPLALLCGANLFALRFLSFLCFLGSIALIFGAVRRAAGEAAAALAAMLALGSPMLLLSTKIFGTEFPLLLAVAALLFFETSAARQRWIGIGLSLGIGALSKASFALVGGPMVVAAVLLRTLRRDDERLALPSLRDHLAGILAGGLIALTWWATNLEPAIGYASTSRRVLRHSLGPLSLPTLGRWTYEFLRCDAGWLAAIAITTIFVLGRWTVHPLVVIALSGAVPQIVASAMGPNHNPRYAAPAMILLAAAAGVIAAPLLERKRVLAVLATLAAAQLVLVSLPSSKPASFVWRGATEVNAPLEQWDFSRVKDVADRLGAPRRPHIAVLGVTYAMNPPQIEAAWIRRGSDAPALTLWPADRAPVFDMHVTLQRAMTADVVITAPDFRGDPLDRQPRDNAHNTEFTRALAATRAFGNPVFVNVGTTEPAVVAVFVRRGAG